MRGLKKHEYCLMSHKQRHLSSNFIWLSKVGCYLSLIPISVFQVRLRNVSITLDVLRPTFRPSEEDQEEVDSEDITARDANVKAVFSSVQDHWDLIASIYKERVRVISQLEASNSLCQPIRALHFRWESCWRDSTTTGALGTRGASRSMPGKEN